MNTSISHKDTNSCVHKCERNGWVVCEKTKKRLNALNELFSSEFNANMEIIKLKKAYIFNDCEFVVKKATLRWEE